MSRAFLALVLQPIIDRYRLYLENGEGSDGRQTGLVKPQIVRNSVAKAVGIVRLLGLSAP